MFEPSRRAALRYDSPSPQQQGFKPYARKHQTVWRDSVAAAEALLDRGWGKPRQSHEAEITHRYVIEIPALMDNATWEAEALEHEPDNLQ
jgi:hypothetical protein